METKIARKFFEVCPFILAVQQNLPDASTKRLPSEIAVNSPPMANKNPARVIAGRLRWLELNLYLDTPKAVLEVLKHFMSAIRSLINSPSKLCRVDERAAKGTFLALSLEPFDGLLDLLATFKACNFQR
jgi:hypothetical protein